MHKNRRLIQPPIVHIIQWFSIWCIISALQNGAIVPIPLNWLLTNTNKYDIVNITKEIRQQQKKIFKITVDKLKQICYTKYNKRKQMEVSVMSIETKIKAIERAYEIIKCKTIKITANDDRPPYATVTIMGYNMCVALKERDLKEADIDELVSFIIYYEEIIKDHMLAMRKKGAI